MTPITSRETRRARALGLRLQRLPGNLGQHPALRFNPGVQGYRDYCFGSRAGPSVHVRHLFHELAHAAQFGPKQFAQRGKSHGFLFKTPTVFIGNRLCDVPDTHQGVERELDTFAHQLHLMQAAGLKTDRNAFFNYSAALMRHMPDWYLVPGRTDAQRFAFCRKQLQQRYKALDQSAALDRLRGWLDATQRRLKRAGSDRSAREVERRYRSDGSYLESAREPTLRAAA